MSSHTKSFMKVISSSFRAQWWPGAGKELQVEDVEDRWVTTSGQQFGKKGLALALYCDLVTLAHRRQHLQWLGRIYPLVLASSIVFPPPLSCFLILHLQRAAWWPYLNIQQVCKQEGSA